MGQDRTSVGDCPEWWVGVPGSVAWRRSAVPDTIHSMIRALHTLIYSDDPEATRAFLRDVLGWPSVADPDTVPPWPIFRTGPAEMGIHPAAGSYEGEPYRHPLGHSVSLMCDDIAATRAELESRGATFTGETTDMGFGLAAEMMLPGAGTILVYEPRHPTAFDLPE